MSCIYIYIHINIDIIISQNNMTQAYKHPESSAKKPSPDFLAEIKPKVCSCRTIFILGTPGPPLSNCSDMIFRKGGREPSSTTMISFRICLSWAADSVELGKNKPVDAAWTWIFHMIFPFDTSWELVVGQPYPKMDGDFSMIYPTECHHRWTIMEKTHWSMGMDIGEIGAALFERMDGLWVSPNHPNQDMTAG